MWYAFRDLFLLLCAASGRGGDPAPGLSRVDPADAPRASFCLYTDDIPARWLAAPWLAGAAAAALVVATAGRVDSPGLAFVMLTAIFGGLLFAFARAFAIGSRGLVPVMWLTDDGLSVNGVGAIPWNRLIDIEPIYASSKVGIYLDGGRIAYAADDGPRSRRFSSSGLDENFEELRDRAIALGAQLQPLSVATDRLRAARARQRAWYRNRGYAPGG